MQEISNVAKNFKPFKNAHLHTPSPSLGKNFGSYCSIENSIEHYSLLSGHLITYTCNYYAQQMK